MIDIDPRLRLILPKLRRKHKDLYLLDLGNVPGGTKVRNILFRPLTRREFLQLQQDAELGCDSTDIVLSTCVIWPKVDWDNIIVNIFYDLPCMIFEYIASAVIQSSGFASNESIAESFKSARMQVNSLDAVLTTLICRTFSGITPKMLDDMTLWDISRLFAMAETSLEQPIDLRLFLDPEYAARVAEREERRRNRRSRVPGVPGRFTKVRGGVPPIPEGWESSAHNAQQAVGDNAHRT